MCGITGFWISEAPSYETGKALDGMIDAVRHRGPDDEGTWFDQEAGLFLGHTRLSVIDVTAEGHQPMVSHSGRYVLTYNGEIFNFRELRAELSPQEWRGHSDTEVMLAAFERWGVERSLERFNGQFALGVWDRTEQVLILARDRLGIKPLYVARQGKLLLFGSQLEALRRHPDFRAEINKEAVYRFLERGYVPGPSSIYEDVTKLEPGHLVRIRRPEEAGLPARYWSLTERATALGPIEGDDHEVVASFEHLLEDAVVKRMIADVPLGAFLSGGIDSSLIVALMQENASGRVQTFSIGFEDDAFDEAPHATRVAAHLGTDHTNLYVAPDETLDLLTELPSIYDEPFADESQLPTALVSRLARQSVTVALSGDGGDECFGGYTRYSRAEEHWRRLNRIPRPFRKLVGACAPSVSACERSPAGRRIVAAAMRLVRPSVTYGQVARQFDLFGASDPLDFYRKSVGLDPRALIGPAVPDEYRGGYSRSVAALEGSGLSIRERMMLSDALTYLPDDILVKVDRASMDVALEVRVPLLDHRVVEFSWRLSDQMRLRNGETKWILRRILQKRLPRALFDRPKQGFAVPLQDWLRGPLKSWAEDHLNARELRDEGLLDQAAVRSLWENHLAARCNAKTMLWRILSLQSWLKSSRNEVRHAAEAGAHA
jgi:asparagine synthase (glutamine-hydrolysing)